MPKNTSYRGNKPIFISWEVLIMVNCTLIFGISFAHHKLQLFLLLQLPYAKNCMAETSFLALSAFSIYDFTGLFFTSTSITHELSQMCNVCKASTVVVSHMYKYDEKDQVLN